MQTEPISKITNEKKDKVLLHNVKLTVNISSFFVAFLENMNFTGLCHLVYSQLQCYALF